MERFEQREISLEQPVNKLIFFQTTNKKQKQKNRILQFFIQNYNEFISFYKNKKLNFILIFIFLFYLFD